MDLTRPISTGMPVFPGDPEVRISTALTCAKDGLEVSGLSFGSHTGTHVDAPSHIVPGGRTVDQLHLDELCGPALVLGIEGLQAEQLITASRIRSLIRDRDAVPARVVLCTGWDRVWDGHDPEDEVVRHPSLAPDAARWLWDAGVRMLGTDTLSPDPTVPVEPADLPVHEVFLGNDGVLVENLVNLTRCRPRQLGSTGGSMAEPAPSDWTATVQLGVYPLPLLGRDGAPARVVARS
ncbi:cyclase family protein [Cellulosimicrobium funkei]|nr:cyclase family protein [Cellulosimicrobium funkei]